MKKLPRFFLITVVVLITAIALFYAYSNWAGANRYNEVLSELKKKNETLRVEELIPPSVPDEQNVAAAPIFQELFAADESSRLGKVLAHWKTVGKLPAGEGRIQQLAKKIDPEFSGDEAAAGELILTTLRDSDELVKEMKHAFQRPHVSWPLEYGKGFLMFLMPLPHLNGSIALGSMLQTKGLAALACGQYDIAFENAEALLFLSETLAPPHLLICELLRCALLEIGRSVVNDGLVRGAWSDSQLVAFSEILERQNLLLSLANSLRLERAVGQQLDWGDPALLTVQQSGQAVPGTTPSHLAWRLRPVGWMHEDKALHAESLQRMIESLGNGHRISAQAIRSTDAPLVASSMFDRLKTPITFLTLPSITGAAETISATQTLVRATMTACAIERYRLSNKSIPERLEQLVPSLLKALPVDPMSGRPLLYKTTKNGGYTVYGIGWNEQDDGGELQSPDNKPARKQLDWGVQIPK